MKPLCEHGVATLGRNFYVNVDGLHEGNALQRQI
jgi:hypothetical protein